MSAPPNRWIGYPLQALCYAAFIAVVGYFATSPPYVHLPAGDALVKLSFQHAGERKEACRERTPEELAKLAPNMRAASVCARERVPVEVALKAMTLWAAWQHYEDDRKGSLTSGKLADMVLLDADPMTVDPDRLAGIKVTDVYKDGRPVELG